MWQRDPIAEPVRTVVASRVPVCRLRTAEWADALVWCLAVVGVMCSVPAIALGQLDFEAAPIRYYDAPVDDAVTRLEADLDAGRVRLDYDGKTGYLRSLLGALGIAPDTQVLVFSKTSFQQRRISPRTPRALYFNDDVYLGWVPDGDVIEIASVDPQQGVIFYTLRQESMAKPRIVRDRGNCLTCHASSRTRGVPGLLVRSVFPSPTGLPHFGAGTFRINHASPLRKRWGGWYVTGTHGKQRHMGNVVVKDRYHPEAIDVDAGANVTDLSGRFDTSRYLTPHSDIVALMVLEHQTDMHNLIVRANFEARLAWHQNAIMNEALEREPDYVSDSTRRRIDRVVDDLLKYMLFTDEIELTDPIRGTSGFAARFSSLGPRDSRGRSLRQLDLKRRLFRYPCSYLVYSAAFRSLPPLVKDRLFERLYRILHGDDPDPAFARLTAADRKAIFEILSETLPDARAAWARLTAGDG
ncbi:MAG: hypothetical protein D6725_13620 [Planctomycetota bacterium]|nr:MAG: hypothetical protein D6725_13620 [Planctomycetota bacterium]